MIVSVVDTVGGVRMPVRDVGTHRLGGNGYAIVVAIDTRDIRRLGDVVLHVRGVSNVFDIREVGRW